MKQSIRVNESELKTLIKESVKMILKESEDKNAYISEIMDTIDFDEILNNGGTCITADMFTGESIDVETNLGEATGEVYITYNGQEYSPRIKFAWTGESMDDIQNAVYKALESLDLDILEKMANGGLWSGDELNETISRAIRKVLFLG